MMAEEARSCKKNGIYVIGCILHLRRKNKQNYYKVSWSDGGEPTGFLLEKELAPYRKFYLSIRRKIRGIKLKDI